MLRCDCTPSANRNGPRQTGRGRWSLGPGGLQRKRLTGSSGWPRHGRQPGEGTRDSSKAHGPIRLHPREPRRNRQRPRNHLGPVGGDARCSDHPGRDPRRARGGVDRDGGRRLHIDPGPTTALPEPGPPGAAGDEGSAANGTGRGPRDPHRGGLQGRRSRGDRGADLAQPDRGARIHDVLRTQAVSRRGGGPHGGRRLRRVGERRGRPSAQRMASSQPPHASILMRRACCSDRMVDIGFPELLTLVQTVAIIIAIVIAVYFSRRQIQALDTDTEARVMNDLDEKLHPMGEIFIENPEFVRVLNDVPAASAGGAGVAFGAEVAFAFYVMFFCAHCYHMRQRGILSDNDWAGWLQWTKNAFRSGRLGKYWKEAEMQAWVDPAFREFVNREILGNT